MLVYFSPNLILVNSLVEPTASTPDPAPTTKQTLAGSSGRKRMILGDRAANDLISSRKNVKVQGQGDKENERPTQSQNQEFVPRRFWDSETSRNWIDCSHCRGEGEKYAGTPWREHDREGANKRVNAHTKNIKVKCTYCRFWYEKWGLIGSLPSK